MEERDSPTMRGSLVPFLAIAPIITLVILAYSAIDTYNLGVDIRKYYGRNIYEPWLIAGVLWLVVAIAIAALLVIELRIRAKGTIQPSLRIALSLSVILNMVLGVRGFDSEALGCGMVSYIPPSDWFNSALALTAITNGPLLAGIACVEHRSLRGPDGMMAKLLCLMNYVFASIAAFLLILSGCLT